MADYTPLYQNYGFGNTNTPYPDFTGGETGGSFFTSQNIGNVGSALGAVASVASTINSIYGGHKSRKLAREQLKMNKEQIARENALEDEDRATLKTAQDKMAKAADNFNYLERS